MYRNTAKLVSSPDHTLYASSERGSGPKKWASFKEAFMRLGYRKQTNSNEEAIHHLIRTKMSSFAYLLVQRSYHAIPLSLSSWLNHLQCSLLAFSCVSLSLQFTVQNSGWLKSSITCFHIGGVALQAQENRRRRQTLSQSLCRGCGLETRLQQNSHNVHLC